MAEKPLLKIDWATYESAKYACENWHYSGSLPVGKLVKIGAWENSKFIGVVLFGRGANNNLGKPYGLAQTQVCELVRIALTEHISPVSQIMSIALRFLKKQLMTMRLVISYAAPEQGHHGGVYQAGNWLYVGRSQAQQEVVVNGKVMHKRTANALFGTIKGLEKSKVFWKHKYLYPLDGEMKSSIEHLKKPYPKRPKHCADATSTEGEGGSTPTRTLQLEKSIEKDLL